MKTFFTSFMMLFFLGFAINVQAQINCNTNMFMSLDQFGQGTMTPDIFLEGNPVYDTATVSPASVDCGDIGTFAVTVTTTTAGVTETCISELTLEDKLPPVVVMKNNLTVCLDANNQYLLTPADLDNGTYDNCSSNITMTVSPNMLDITHLNTNVVVTLTAEDEYGNSNSSWATVHVSSPTSTMSCVALIEGIISTPSEVLTIDVVDLLESTDGCGGNYLMDLLDDNGNLIIGGVTSADVPGEGAYSYIVNNTLTGNSCWGLISLQTATSTGCGSLACDNSVVATQTIDPATGQVLPMTFYAADLLDGTYTCDLSTLLIEVTSAQGGSLVASGTGSVTMIYSGIYTFAITDPATGNSCWSSLEIIGNSPCPPATTYAPAAELLFNIVGINVSNASDIFQPDNLINNYNIDPADALPTWDPNACSLIAVAWSDEVFDLGNGEFKILRTFTLVDWLTSNVTTYEQIIKNLILVEYICDFLDHSTPVTDCAQGHSDIDDVEWPADLMVDDHRITPTELINFSSVSTMDADPTFYNDPTLYSSSYIDILKSLTTTELVLDRQWTVERSDLPGVAWTYTQEITVDFSDFSTLVTAGTQTGRAVPGVEVGSTIFTDVNGAANVGPTQALTTPSKIDESLNGVNILDLVMHRDYILAVQNLNQYQQLAADVDGNGMVSILDVVLLSRIILKEDNAISTWAFIDESNNVTTSIKPRADYRAIKMGDLDDDAVLNGMTPTYPTIGASYEDVLLNQGESYLVALNIDATENLRGVEMRFQLDTDMINVTGVIGTVDWNITNEGELVVILVDNIDPTSAIFEVQIEALGNGILSQNMSFYQDQTSLVVNLNDELLQVEGTVENEITSGNKDLIQDLGFSVYPNPAAQIIYVDNSLFTTDFEMVFFDLSGKQIARYINPTQIELSQFNSGLYTYLIRTKEQVQTGKLSIVK